MTEVREITANWVEGREMVRDWMQRAVTQLKALEPSMPESRAVDRLGIEGLLKEAEQWDSTKSAGAE